MDIRPSQQNSLYSLLNSINDAKTENEQLNALNNFYTATAEKSYKIAEEDFKKNSRKILAYIVTAWFFLVNILTLVAIGFIFYLECSNQFLLGKGVINTTVITALITATIVQNAAVFVVFAKYAFGFELKPATKKNLN